MVVTWTSKKMPWSFNRYPLKVRDIISEEHPPPYDKVTSGTVASNLKAKALKANQRMYDDFATKICKALEERTAKGHLKCTFAIYDVNKIIQWNDDASIRLFNLNDFANFLDLYLHEDNRNRLFQLLNSKYGFVVSNVVTGKSHLYKTKDGKATKKRTHKDVRYVQFTIDLTESPRSEHDQSVSGI